MENVTDNGMGKNSITLDNGEDKNAVVVEVFLQGHWKLMGYIPGNKVPKLQAALNKDEITSIKIAYIACTYCHRVNQ